MRRKRCAAGSGKTQAAGRARPYCAIICRSVVAPLSEPERSFIDRIPGLWAAIAAGEFLATWRSGYAAVCKTVYPGSIPGVASTREINRLGDREGGRPDPRHAAAYDHQHRAAGARQYVAAVRGGPRMRPGRHGGEMRVVRCSDSDDEAEPAPRRAPLGNTGF
jgi:hypothetical protein